MILGTSLLDRGGNKSDSVSSVQHYTRPVDRWVQLYDSYHAFSIVKCGTSCPVLNGYLFVQLRIGNRNIPLSRNLTGYNSWNINITFACTDNGINTAQLNITFDNATFNGITEELTDASASLFSLQFIYREEPVNEKPVDFLSPSAYIHMKHPNSERGNCLLNASSTTKLGGGSVRKLILLVLAFTMIQTCFQ